jgi:hypothetical protein
MSGVRPQRIDGSRLTENRKDTSECRRVGTVHCHRERQDAANLAVLPAWHNRCNVTDGVHLIVAALTVGEWQKLSLTECTPNHSDPADDWE